MYSAVIDMPPRSCLTRLAVSVEPAQEQAKRRRLVCKSGSIPLLHGAPDQWKKASRAASWLVADRENVAALYPCSVTAPGAAVGEPIPPYASAPSAVEP